MKLNLSQVKSIVKGAEYIEEIDSKIYFSRFTKDEKNMYKNYYDNFYNKCFASAGIRMEFITDSEFINLSVQVKPRSSRRFSRTSLYVNKCLLDVLSVQFEDDNVVNTEKSFLLGKGVKQICIYLPWSSDFVLESMELSDNCYIKPVNKKYKGIIYGDSITQGYDATYPEDSYANKIADFFDAECIDKGIGGEIFVPDLIRAAEKKPVDFVTVAYGTNDYGGMVSKEDFNERCSDFYKLISEKYEDSKIFALCPIYRGDIEKGHPIEDLSYVSQKIKEFTQNLKNVQVIDCYDFVPKDEKYFSDKVLHPNSDGFEFYSKSLINELKKYL